MDKLVGRSPAEIIKYYKSVISGLINYYSGSERLSDLYGFIYTLRRSAALTVSHFYKKKTAKWAFDKYGTELRIPAMTDGNGKPIKYVELTIPPLEKKYYRWRTGRAEELYKISKQIPLGTKYGTTYTVVKSANELKCAIPGCGNDADQ